jgi:ornithine cyclodeaminase
MSKQQPLGFLAMALTVITEEQVRSVADASAVMVAIRDAFVSNLNSRFEIPVRQQLELAGGVLLLMPCCDRALGMEGVKIVTVSPQSGVNAAYLLQDSSRRTRAFLEANYLTDVRTAATSALATDLLARPNAETLGVFGSGRQAAAHLAVLGEVRSFRRYLVCGRPGRDINPFIERIGNQLGVQLQAASSAVLASESDVLCTCTTANEPLFDGARLRPGTHLNLVGAFRPQARETDDETVRRSRVVVDTYQGALAESGDLLIPLANGSLRREQIVADLHELATGAKIGRTTDQDITIFKSLGCALEDLAVALLVYERTSGSQIRRPAYEGDLN